MSQVLAAALSRLLDNSVDTAGTAFTVAQRRMLDEFARKTGAVQLRKEGRGSVYRVLNSDLVHAHLRSLRPIAPDQINDAMPQRAINIAQARNSKLGSHGHGGFYVLVKAISAGVSWQPGANGERGAFDLSAVTEVAGVGALALTETDEWHSDQPLWLVENQALFDRLDWLPPQSTGTVAYYGGQIPESWLRWLSARRRASAVLLFPDYDGVGLMNYARLKEVCASACAFWLMPDWKQRLGAFGNNQVWRNTFGEFQSAMLRLKMLGLEDELAELCEGLRSSGMALEQESVWLTVP